MTRIIATVTNDLSYDQRMIRICTSLAASGRTVLLVGRQLPKSIPLADQPFHQRRLRCFFHSGKLFYAEYNLRLFFFLLFQKADLFCAVDLDTLLPCYLTGRLRRKTVVYDAHEYFTEVPEVVRRPGIQKVWEWIARRIIPKVRYCYTVGPQLARILSERYNTSFAVIRNLPYSRELLPAPKPDIPVLLYQGALNEGRGLEQLIDAMELLSPPVELWLAGEGDRSSALRERAAKPTLEGRIRFLGYVLPQKLPELTQQATIGLNLLENKGLSYYYSLANKAFDYIQAGIPSLQMNFPEYRALQEEFAPFVLVDHLDPADLAARIRSLLNQPAYYEQLRSNCMAAARVLNWEEEEKHLLDFYNQIVNAKG